jgi:hypothetical protein
MLKGESGISILVIHEMFLKGHLVDVNDIAALLTSLKEVRDLG